MQTLIENIFGTYTPVSEIAYAVGADGVAYSYNYIPSGLAGVDWQYVAGVFLFGIMLYSTLRILGALIKNG